MPKVEYSPDARQDLIDIGAYIARDNPTAARKWVKKLREKCEMLAANPKFGERRTDFGLPDCRCFRVGNYVIFFRSMADGVEIARVVHGSRDLRRL